MEINLIDTYIDIKCEQFICNLFLFQSSNCPGRKPGRVIKMSNLLGIPLLQFYALTIALLYCNTQIPSNWPTIITVPLEDDNVIRNVAFFFCVLKSDTE